MAQMTYLVVNFFLDGNLGFLSFDSDSSISVTLCGSMEQSVFPKRYISPYLPCSSLKLILKQKLIDIAESQMARRGTFSVTFTTNRGCKAMYVSGGATITVLKDGTGTTRVPVVSC
ncbi:hypothetical protein YC2023_016789 [Brassica napus]